MKWTPYSETNMPEWAKFLLYLSLYILPCIPFGVWALIEYLTGMNK